MPTILTLQNVKWKRTVVIKIHREKTEKQSEEKKDNKKEVQLKRETSTCSNGTR